MKKFRLFWLLCTFGLLVIAQTRESDRLLQQSFETADSNPDESLKVAQYLIKTSDDEHQKSQAFLLSALANYTKGNYEESLTDAFVARNLSTGKKRSEIFIKSTEIIAEILRFLQLDEASDNYIAEISDAQTKEMLNSRGLNPVDFLISRGENYFSEKQYDSSVIVLEDALKMAQKTENSFLQLDIHQKLSANFLALDNKQAYNSHNQEALALRNLTTRLENNASNTAHQLINEEKDKDLERIRNQHAYTLWSLLGTVFLCILVRIFLFIRNKNKVKTYEILINYLNKEKISEQPQDEVSNENQRAATMLKESENQILLGLKKFESSKRFINRDMSLGMLAAQLNTNTKYLSEIINRHKEKNFNSYINELRINYITDKIKNEPAYLNYKVSYLAEECGFASHSTFTTVFKSVVGVSPITFVEFVKTEINNEKEIPV